MIANPTDWSAWPALSPAAMRTRLNRRLKRSITNNDLIALYNLLMLGVESDPAKVARQAEVLISVFASRGMNVGTLLFLELAVRAWSSARDVSKAFAALERMPVLISTECERKDLLELTDDVWSGLARAPFPADATPVIFASLSKVFRRLGDIERLASVYLGAADLFEDHGAIAQAVRALRDAETAARETGSLAILATCYQKLASIAYREKLFEEVLEIGETATAVHSEMGEPPPPWLMNTIATALMHLDRDAEATALYEEEIAGADDPRVLAGLWMNLAAARRKAGDLAGAEEAIVRARSMVDEDAAPEIGLELELITARIDAQALRFDAAATSLNRAVERMTENLRSVLRLHRRRRLRDRYITRFEMVLADMPQQGAIDAVLPALATIRGSMSADWLSLLDWSAACRRDERVKRSDREALRAAIDHIKAVGAPFLYGYREKYDDPWEPVNYARPWDDLSALMPRLAPMAGSDPYEGADPVRAADLLRQRLAEGYILVIPTVAHGHLRLWILSGKAYRHVDLDKVATRDIFVQRALYGQLSVSRSDFASTLNRSLDALANEVTSIFDEALATGARGVLYFQEPLDQLPLFALAGQHEGVRQAMSAGTFELRYTPILYRQGPLPAGAWTNVLSMTDPNDTDLLLSRFEGGVAASLIEASSHRALESSDRAGFAREALDADVILISAHGDSIAHFVDPHFAKLGRGDHAINVQDLQEIVPTARARLVILNACHSGAGTSRGLYDTLRTHDIASYPGLMLLNGYSCVSAAGWRISDTTGFVFACLVAGFVRTGDGPAKALCKASGALWSFTRSEVLALFEHLPDVTARDLARDRIAQAPEVGMFSHAYVSGGIQVVTLV